MNETRNKIKCEGLNDLSNWQNNKWMEMWMKELRDKGWVDKLINEWTIVLMKDEWKSKEIDGWMNKRNCQKMEERIREWNKR